MSDAMIRVERQGNFTVLPNDMLRDPRLSLKTKGLMCVILSLPPDWDYSVSGLAKINNVGRDTIRSSLQELEKAQYLNRSQEHDTDGKFAGNVYVIHDVSQTPLPENPTTVNVSAECTNSAPLPGKPSAGEPSSDNPLPDFPPQLNKDLQNKDLTNTPIPPKKGALPMEVRKIIESYSGEDKQLQESILAFTEHRAKKRKPIRSARQINLFLNRLKQYSGGNREIKIQIIEEAIFRDWDSVYPPKQDSMTRVSQPAKVIVSEEVPTW